MHCCYPILMQARFDASDFLLTLVCGGVVSVAAYTEDKRLLQSYHDDDANVTILMCAQKLTVTDASCTAQNHKLKQKREDLKIKMDTGYAQKKRCQARNRGPAVLIKWTNLMTWSLSAVWNSTQHCIM